MKKIYVILALLLIGNFGFGQTTVTYDFSAAGASTSGNLDTNISFTTAANNSATAPNIVSSQLRLYGPNTSNQKGGSIIITPLNGVTITNVVINASIRMGNAGYTVDGGTEVLIIGGSSYTISSISALTQVDFYQKQNGNNKEIYVDNFSVTYTVPTPVTYTYTGTWSPSDPNGTSSSIDNIIVASGDATISANTGVSDVTVNPGASITVNTGITLTASEVTLESASNTYSSLIQDGAIVGSIKYKRYVNANSGGNDLIAPPLSGETWANFLGSDTNAADLLDNGLTSPTTYAFAPFNKPANTYDNFTDATAATLVSGTGYRAATDLGTTLTFTGTVPTTAVTVDITDEGLTHPDWNLVGNPYPSYIHMYDFLNHEVGGTGSGVYNYQLLEDLSGIYGYDGDALDGWNVTTLSDASDGRLMAPGQGFLVAANDAQVAGYNLTFDTNMRRTGSSDDFIAGRNVNVLTYLKLNASNANNNYSTRFYFNEESSQGADHGYDGKVWGTPPNFALYSHLVQENTGLAMALQSLNTSDMMDVLIPLGVNASSGEQLTITISESTLPTTVKVYLDDALNNTSTLLNTSDFVITPNTSLNGTGRFYLRVTDNALSTTKNTLEDITLYTNETDKTIVVAGQLLDTTTVYVYDLQGRIVNTSILETAQGSQSIDVSNLSTGVYVIQLRNATGTRTQKVILR